MSTSNTTNEAEAKESKRAPVAIVGAGLAGLLCACILERHQIPYVVFEREAGPNLDQGDPRLEGRNVDLRDSAGIKALKEAGLFGKFKNEAKPQRVPRTKVLHDIQGRVVQMDPSTRLPIALKLGGSAEKKEVSRVNCATLVDFLLRQIPKKKIHWGKGVVEIGREQSQTTGLETQGWSLRFSDGTSESGFPLIVGADGAQGRVRSLITETKLQYRDGGYGVYIYIFAYEPNPKGPVRVVVLPEVSASNDTPPERWNQAPGRFVEGLQLNLSNVEDTRKKLLNSKGLFRDYPDNLKAYIRKAEGPWRLWPLYYDSDFSIQQFRTPGKFPRPENWKRVPGVALIGDAAHVLLPSGEEGANMALQDAAELSRQLKDLNYPYDPDGIEGAIEAYEKSMLPRAFEYIDDDLGETAHSMCATIVKIYLELYSAYGHAGDSK
ncbi:hypothetical protein F5Y17DRAFT_457493 [Xylariaceae sp. FL0594]|nr:hypothetical protein F5Y17DRAFT_457493 [Xylariaceae sp. FL0594]